MARCLLVLACVLLVPVSLFTRIPAAAQEQPIFRAGITYIEVDVAVTDRAGSFVRDLTADDFELFDADQPQQVASFELVDLALPEAQPWRATSTRDLTRTYSDETIRPEGRVYALLLDMGGMSHNPSSPLQREADHIRRVQRLARQFIESSLGPDDVMSVLYVATGGAWLAQELTQSRPLLRGAINTFGQRPSARVGGVLVDSSRQLERRRGGTYRALRETAETLGRVTGRRKAILWIGGNVPFHPGSAETEVSYRNAIRTATRHNVTIYPIDPNGLSAGLNGRPISAESSRGFLDNRRPGAELMRLAGLRGVAHDTGGIAVVNTNNFSGGFTRIVRDHSTYYLLGYYPTIQHQDGRFQTIRVRVRRPGVSVRSRPGYFAVDSRTAPAASPSLVTRSDAEQAIDLLGPTDARTPFHVRVSSWLPDAENDTTALWIVGEIDTRTRGIGRWRAGATAEIIVRTPGGTTLLETRRGLSADEPVFGVLLSESDSPVPDAYVVRIVVTEEGSVVHAQTMAIDARDGWSPIGEAVLWRRGPATGPRYVRTADVRFRRNERLQLELPTSLRGPAIARVLDRSGASREIPLDVVQRRDGNIGWIAVDVPLSAFAPADYVVEVAQGEARRVTAFRVIP